MYGVRSKEPIMFAITKDLLADLSAKPGTNANAVGIDLFVVKFGTGRADLRAYPSA